MLKIHLDEILKEKNMSLTDLHVITGLSMNSLSLLKNGKREGISFDTLEKLADALDVGIEEIISKENRDFNTGQQQEHYYEGNILFLYDKKELGKKLREIRSIKTMAVFAEELGITKGTLNNYEKGRYVPGNLIFEKLSNESNIHARFNFIYESKSNLVNHLVNTFTHITKDSAIYIVENMYQGNINVVNKQAVLKEIYNIQPNIIEDEKFLLLCKRYGVEYLKSRYTIEENDLYKKELLPLLDGFLKSNDDILFLIEIFKNIYYSDKNFNDDKSRNQLIQQIEKMIAANEVRNLFIKEVDKAYAYLGETHEIQ